MSQQLLETLAEYVTPHKQALFANVLRERTRWLTVVLEDVFQSHNMSACLRSCECFGVQDVHVIETYNDFEVNVDISRGASQWLTVHRAPLEHQTTAGRLQELKTRGYRLVGTSPHEESCTLEELEVSRPTALVFGAEKEGLSEEATQQIDACLKIPMVGMTESMNLSVALAICLHTLTARLRESTVNWQLSDEEREYLLITWMRRVVKKHWPALEKRLTGEFPELSGFV